MTASEQTPPHSPLLRALQSVEFPKKLGLCEKLFGSRLREKGVCWTTASNGVLWKFDLANPTHRWILYGDYEGAGFLTWCRATLPADAVIVDSGANIGQIVLYLAPRLRGGRLLAVEPGAGARGWLEECLRRHPDWPVEVLSCGLGRQKGTLYLADAGPEHTVGSWSRISESEGQPTPILPLDEVLEQRGIRRVHLWKLDMEGWEPEALAGAERTLSERRIDSLYVELSPETRSRIHQFLRGFGYRGFIFGGWGNRRLLPAVEHQEDLDYALFLKQGADAPSR